VTISLLCFAIILLITYWLSDSGALGAFLHLACVITAGALAFAVWEPLAYLLMGTGAGNYAKGTVLLGSFLGLLLLLRMLADRTVPRDVPLPKGPNMALGALFGAAAGVLSVGMLVIGGGFLQSTVSIYDLTGWSRRSDVPAAPTIGSDEANILPVVQATAGFYGHLSSGPFSALPLGGDAGTLRTHAPQVDRTALSLYRDSFADGMGRVSIQPAAVTSLKLYDVSRAKLSSGVSAAEKPAWGVEFGVSQESFDGNGMQFVMSASQIRLIGDGRSGAASVAHPLAWTQPDANGNPKQYFFNSATSYASSPSSQGEGRFVALFDKAQLEGQAPHFVEIKGIRFRLPAPIAREGALEDLGAPGAPLFKDPDATDITALVDFPSAKFGMKGVTINLNSKGGLQVDSENFITGGEQKFPKASSSSVSSELQVKGFRVNEGERLLRLDASAREGGARLFPDVNPWVTEAGAAAQNARVAVIDARGAKYYAIGYIFDDSEYVQVKSFGGSPIPLRGLPVQSLGGSTSLVLYFRVPAETQVAGLVVSTGAEDRLVNVIKATAPKD